MVARDVLLGIGIGAAVAYAADPIAGRRRRAVARDQLVRAGRKTRDALDATARDLANRTSGAMAVTRARWSDGPVEDDRLAARVRARLGRVCSYPKAIHVEARDGIVTLRGPILADDLEDVLGATAAVPGVTAISSDLEPYASAGDVPGLQGRERRSGPALDLLQRTWSPATRALVTAAGIAATGISLAAYARRPRSDRSMA